MIWTKKKLHELKISIPWGCVNRVTSADLEEFLEFSCIREGIKLLNLQGVAVVSDAKGYWRTRTPSELSAYAKRLEGRAASILQRAKAVRRIAR